MPAPSLSWTLFAEILDAKYIQFFFNTGTAMRSFFELLNGRNLHQNGLIFVPVISGTALQLVIITDITDHEYFILHLHGKL